VLLVLEFLAAMWIRGIVFAAGLFGLMSLLLGLAVAVFHVLSLKAGQRAHARSAIYATAESVFLIAFVSSACMAVLAGIFALPVIFNTGWHPMQPRWRVPSILGMRVAHGDAVLAEAGRRRRSGASVRDALPLNSRTRLEQFNEFLTWQPGLADYSRQGSDRYVS
jgi:hypothetical protein